MEFSEKLIRLRKTKQLTQTDLANALGVSRQAVYKWECGQSYPEAMKLVALKELFGISIDDMLNPEFEVAMPKRKRRAKAALLSVEGVTAPAAEEAAKAEPAPVEEAPAPVEEAPKAEEPAPVEEAPEAETAEIETMEIPEAEGIGTPAEEMPAAPAAEEAPAPAEKEKAEEKKGFFSRLFGRK